MNLYLRYFDAEALVDSLDKAIDFLQSIPDIDVDEFLYNDLRDYYEGDFRFPKRYKTHQHAYFIAIKTTATTLEEFKDHAGERTNMPTAREQKDSVNALLVADMPGWYEATVAFKRNIENVETGKCEYIDDTFSARVKARCPRECYDIIIDYLRNREDIDPRSQFPSIKGRNFSYKYLGID